MAITLSLVSDEMDKEDLQQMTRQLCGDLRDEAGVDAALATQAAGAGAKSIDVELIGKILLAAADCVAHSSKASKCSCSVNPPSQTVRCGVTRQTTLTKSHGPRQPLMVS